MSNPDKVESATTSRRSPRRSRELDAAPHRYMLEDHPFIVPLITVLLAGFCAYATIFSSLARDVMLPPNAGREMLANFNSGMGWVAGIALAFLFISSIFLVMNAIGHAVELSRRKPVTCPRCASKEQRARSFPRTRIKDTPWEEVRCPNCTHSWYNKV